MPHKADNLIVYVRWDVIKKWKEGERAAIQNARLQPRQLAPYAYGSDQCRLMNLCKRGTVLWVVSSPRINGNLLPPALIARLRIRKCVDLKDPDADLSQIPEYFKTKVWKNRKRECVNEARWRYVALAYKQPHSQYLALNNAWRTMKRFRFGGTVTLERAAREKYGSGPIRNLYSEVPMHLQTIRELPAHEANQMLEHFEHVHGGTVVFVSYRHRYAKRLAEALAERCIERRMGCWIDKWNIPSTGDKDEPKQIEDTRLQSALDNALRQSTVFVALVKGGYHCSGNWTEFEWQRACAEKESPKRTRPLEMIEVLLSGDASNDRSVVVISGTGSADDQLPNRIVGRIEGMGTTNKGAASKLSRRKM